MNAARPATGPLDQLLLCSGAAAAHLWRDALTPVPTRLRSGPRPISQPLLSPCLLGSLLEVIPVHFHQSGFNGTARARRAAFLTQDAPGPLISGNAGASVRACQPAWSTRDRRSTSLTASSRPRPYVLRELGAALVLVSIEQTRSIYGRSTEFCVSFHQRTFFTRACGPINPGRDCATKHQPPRVLNAEAPFSRAQFSAHSGARAACPSPVKLTESLDSQFLFPFSRRQRATQKAIPPTPLILRAYPAPIGPSCSATPQARPAPIKGKLPPRTPQQRGCESPQAALRVCFVSSAELPNTQTTRTPSCGVTPRALRVTLNCHASCSRLRYAVSSHCHGVCVQHKGGKWVAR